MYNILYCFNKVECMHYCGVLRGIPTYKHDCYYMNAHGDVCARCRACVRVCVMRSADLISGYCVTHTPDRVVMQTSRRYDTISYVI